MSVPTADDLLPEGFTRHLLDILLANPRGIDEHALIKVLAQAFPDSLFAVPDALRDPLRLFQLHFLLFHILYRLSDELAGSDRQLRIHTLGIAVIGRPPSVPGVRRADPLRDYYLDWSQWAATHAEDVERLLEGFWSGQASVSADELGEALSLFGLREPVGSREVKRRYRALISAHHPDRGGSTAYVQQLNRALLILQRYYGKA